MFDKMSPSYPSPKFYLIVIVSLSFCEVLAEDLYRGSVDQRYHQRSLEHSNNYSTGNIGHKIHNGSTGHKPVLSADPSTVSAYSRGSLILPANNELQLNKGFQKPALGPSIQHGDRNQVARGSNDWSQSSSDLVRSHKSDQSEARTYSSPNLELALRQASIDENFFQSPPVPGPSDHQWSVTTEQERSSTSEIPELISIPVANRNQTPPPHAGHEQSNQMIISNEIPSIYHNPSTEGPIATASQVSVSHNRTNLSSPSPTTSIELNNQVIYEGLATVPPAGDYYYSSNHGSGGDPRQQLDSGRSSNNWW